MDRLTCTLRRLSGIALAFAGLATGCGDDGAAPGVTGPPPTTGTTTGTTGGTTGGSTGVDSFGSAGGSSGSSTGAPPMLEVDCNMPPLGAVGATYDHTFLASGAMGSPTFSAVGLPPGLVLNPVTGQVTGTATAEGTYDVEVTAATGGAMGATGMATCTIEIAPALGVDLSGLAAPCLGPDDDLLSFLTGGNGAPVTCSTPGGTGNGTPPAGIAVDPDTCAITGTLAETRYGTFVWMTRVEQQGAYAWVPQCVTNATPEPGSYTMEVDHEGQMDAALVPGRGTFTAGQPIAYGAAAGDPLFRIIGGCAPNACYYGYAYGISASPFDADTLTLAPASLLSDPMGNKLGMTHELSISGPAVPAAFEGRIWLLHLTFDYCLAPDAATCSGVDAIKQNGKGKLVYDVVMFPAP
ncbi:MAG: hypothetical protein D6705_14765 [Deltaproteobacteria bacterium]|nr:MAG: hypothetical protein D6705_14765 [Deltaproteobacteria bacterium]